MIYAFNKMITLLLSCNPNTRELMGLNPEHYLYLNDIGQMLLDHKKLFLSRRAINSFGGYADAQFCRLQNALARDTFPQSEKEQHIFNSVRNAIRDFNRKYKNFENGSMEIFIDKAVNPELETEIFVNANMTHYPLRDYANMWNTMANVVHDYEKRLHYAAENTDLPEEPDMAKVQDLVMTINERVVRDEIWEG